MPEHRDLGQTTRGHMSDADRLMDCLSDARERALTYAKSALESTNNGVREFFLALHGEETHNQEVIFRFLHVRGYYPVDEATQDDIRDMRRRYHVIHDNMGLTDDPSFRRYQSADPRSHPATAQAPEHFDQRSRH